MPDVPVSLEYLIRVVCDVAGHSLEIQHPDLALRPGDRVIWYFAGVPVGWTPWIQLKPDETEGGFLGPFSALSQIETGVWAMVADTAPLAAYTYRACLQKGLGLGWEASTSVVCSRQAKIAVHGEPPLMPATFRVTEVVAGKLGVEPDHQELQTGQAVIWDFADVPADFAKWRPRIDFELYEGDGTVAVPALGPFTCLSYESKRIIGYGNNGMLGHYHFQVSLISVSTDEVRWVSSGDPVIDNQGPVWSPVSGGPSGG